MALKGGTALNVFHLALDRLSVDIDLNYIATSGLDASEDVRLRIAQAPMLAWKAQHVAAHMKSAPAGGEASSNA